MKTNKQIETAQELIKGLQDYIELAKTEKKLKLETNKEDINKMIEALVDGAKALVNEL